MARLDSDDILKVFGAVDGGGGGVLPCLETPTGGVKNAQGNADGAQLVEIAGGAVTAPTLAALLASPTLHTPITKSDDTDVTAFANFGVYVGGAGELHYRLTGAPGTTVPLNVVAGQFVYGQFTRVMAATTATGIVGVSR